MSEIKKDRDGFVLAESLSHLRLIGTVHLWQVVGGKAKSLTDSIHLQHLERIINFSQDKFFANMSEHQRGKIANGFYWINHYTKTGNYVLCDTWTEKIESQLKVRGLIVEDEL